MKLSVQYTLQTMLQTHMSYESLLQCRGIWQYHDTYTSIVTQLFPDGQSGGAIGGEYIYLYRKHCFIFPFK